jgi:hypothetical protein
MYVIKNQNKQKRVASMQPPNLSVYGNQPLYSSPKTAWVNFLLFSLSLVSAADGIDKGDENAFREEI